MSEIEILKRIPAFSSFDSKIIDLICETGKKASFRAGQQIFPDSIENKSALIIVSAGKLKVIFAGSDESHILLSYLNAGDYWGEFGLLDGNNLNAEIFAEEDSELVIFTKHNLLKNMEDDKDTLLKLIEQITAKLRESYFALDSLLVKDSDAKVARTIMKLGLENGIVKSGVMEIERLPIQQELAKMAGTSRETLSRTLQSFTKKKLIETDGDKLRIKNFIKLRELLN